MNKQGIRNQVLALLNRNDCTNDIADSFIDQAVSRIQRTLRVPAMEKLSTYTVNAFDRDTLVLPNDFLNLKYLFVEGVLLEWVDLGFFLQQPADTGIPRYYTRLQGSIKMRPVPAENTTVTLVYYGEIPDLIEDDDTNFVTDIAPDLLVYGALVFAADYYVDDRKQLFEDSFSRIYGEVVESARLVEMEQSAMRVQPSYSSPY